jgi:hypothetical protein
MNKPKTKEVEEVLKKNQALTAQVNKLENKIQSMENKSQDNQPPLKPRFAEDGLIMLDGSKSYPDHIYSSLTQTDKEYLNALRKQNKTPQRGGGGNNFKRVYPDIVNKFAPNNDKGQREGKDKDGNPTGKTEFYCSTCKFWTATHGDTHPTRKHDPEYKAKLRAQLNKDNRDSSTSSTTSSTNSESSSTSAGASTYATSGKQVRFLNEDAVEESTTTPITYYNSAAPFGFGLLDLIDEDH